MVFEEAFDHAKESRQALRDLKVQTLSYRGFFNAMI